MTYYNIKTCHGVETIDELDRNDYATYRDYRDERRRLLLEYRLAGVAVYTSNRATREWRTK